MIKVGCISFVLKLNQQPLIICFFFHFELILANITEFGLTPLFTRDELAGADVSMILYPLSAFRAMNKAAENVYNAIRT